MIYTKPANAQTRIGELYSNCSDSILRASILRDGLYLIQHNDSFSFKSQNNKNDFKKSSVVGIASYCILQEDSQGLLFLVKNKGLFLKKDTKLFSIGLDCGIIDSSILHIGFYGVKKRIFVQASSGCYLSRQDTVLKFINFPEHAFFAAMSDSTKRVWRRFKWKRRLLYPFSLLLRGTAQASAYSATKTETEDLRDKHAISRKQIRLLRKELRPGDLLVKRSEDNMSNWVIPGFWTHVGIYIGGVKQLDDFFKNMSLLAGQLPSEFLNKYYPKVYRRIKLVQYPIIESVTQKGVSINPLVHLALADHLGVLRPIISKEQLFLSLIRACSLYDQPYDFNFNFESTGSAVCTALVYKSFACSEQFSCLHFELESFMGQAFLFPGSLVKKFDLEWLSETPELSFVLFLDSDSKQKKAYISTEEEFKNTWKR